jgi:hypothetical protein
MHVIAKSLDLRDMGAALTATKNQLQAWNATCFCANNTEETLQITKHQRAALPSDDNALQPFAGTAI